MVLRFFLAVFLVSAELNSPAQKAISYPRFAAFYNRVMKQPQIRRQFDPLRREIAGQAHGVVLEVGAGGGQNFSFYDRSRVVRVEAIEPDETMLVYAEDNQMNTSVPITLTRASVETLLVNSVNVRRFLRRNVGNRREW